MTRFYLTTALLALILSGVALWQSLHYTSAEKPAYVIGLGEIMTAVQMRHAKLGIAGQNANWELAAYELDELDEGLEDALTWHPNHKSVPRPLTDMIPDYTKQPMADLRAAVAAQDSKLFAASFDALTGSCNACHQEAKFGFNRVINPTGSPVSNQDFRP